jgi:sulfatase maturation enzyme AslB (radical SAM superfamily)
VIAKFLNTTIISHDGNCHACKWLPLCGGGCLELRLFGSPNVPVSQWPRTIRYRHASRIKRGWQDLA